MQPFADMKVFDNRRFVWQCIAGGLIWSTGAALVALALADRTQPNGNGAITLEWKSLVMVDYLKDLLGEMALLRHADEDLAYMLEMLVSAGVIEVFESRSGQWGYFSHGRTREEIAADQRAMLGAVWGQR